MEEKLRDFCDSNGWNRGVFFMTIRIAVTGKTVTPPLFDTIEVLGKEKTIMRLEKSISVLSTQSPEM